MKNKHIKTELPGPKARELLARDALVVSPSYPRDYPRQQLAYAADNGRK